jgi:nucleoside 2-deoxyribosyltransferase
MAQYKAFLASPYRKEFKWLRNAIAAACRQLNVDLRVADEIVTPGTNILSAMHYEIANSDLGLAIVTGLNPNVMYELGLLHQASKPTILLSDEATVQNLPFDLKTFMVLSYNASAKNEAQLRDAVTAAMGRVILLFDHANRTAIAMGQAQTVPPQTHVGVQISVADYDFESIKDRAAKAVGRKSCTTNNISVYDKDGFRGWRLRAKCAGGDKITVIIDLNGEISEIDAD